MVDIKFMIKGLFELLLYFRLKNKSFLGQKTK